MAGPRVQAAAVRPRAPRRAPSKTPSQELLERSEIAANKAVAAYLRAHPHALAPPPSRVSRIARAFKHAMYLGVALASVRWAVPMILAFMDHGCDSGTFERAAMAATAMVIRIAPRIPRETAEEAAQHMVRLACASAPNLQVKWNQLIRYLDNDVTPKARQALYDLGRAIMMVAGMLKGLAVSQVTQLLDQK